MKSFSAVTKTELAFCSNTEHCFRRNFNVGESVTKYGGAQKERKLDENRSEPWQVSYVVVSEHRSLLSQKSFEG